MNVLVTGGLGFVGSNLVDLLISSGNYNVQVIDNCISESSYIEYKNSKAHYIIDDVQYINNYPQLRGFDIIYHLGAMARIQPSFDSPALTLRNNFLSTLAVCEFAKNNDTRLVYAGSSSFYSGVKNSPYAFSKWAGEELCDLYSRVYKLSVVTTRFFNVYGNRQPSIGDSATVIGIFENQFKNKTPFTIYGNGEQKRDFTHVSDICSGLITLGESPIQGIYNLGTSTNYSINEIADIFDEIAGKKLQRQYLPVRINEAQETLADISKTIENTVWKPVYDLKTYLMQKYNATGQDN